MSSADNLCNHFGPGSGLTELRSQSSDPERLFEKFMFEKSADNNKSMKNYSASKELTYLTVKA